MFFHLKWKLVSLHNHSISQALLQVFKHLWNHSFIFNNSAIIHSWFACCWSTLLSPDLTGNRFLILFSSVELFLISMTKIYIALTMGTESEVFLDKHAPSASLPFEAKTVLIQSWLNNDMWEVVCYEFLWYGLLLPISPPFVRILLNYFMTNSPGKSDFVIKSLIVPWFWE